MIEASEAQWVLVSVLEALYLKIMFSELNAFYCLKQLDICINRIKPFFIILATVVLFIIQMAYCLTNTHFLNHSALTLMALMSLQSICLSWKGNIVELACVVLSGAIYHSQLILVFFSFI